MKDWQRRVLEERNTLHVKKQKLELFLESPESPACSLARDLLKAQLGIMEAYWNILEARRVNWISEETR